MGCGGSVQEPKKQKTQEEYKAERMKVRAAIRDRIMKPLQEFRFATQEKEWKQLPSTHKLDSSCEVSLHGKYVGYTQPTQQTDDDLRDAINKQYNNSRSMSQKSGHYSDTSKSERGTHMSANSGKSSHHSQGASNEDGGEVRSERSATNVGNSPSQYSIVSYGSSNKMTKGMAFAQRNSILDKDLHTNAIKVIEHRESLARFSKVSSDQLAGLTVSKRHTMSLDEYQAVEALPGQVVKTSTGPIDKNLESRLSKLQEERKQEDEHRRCSVASFRHMRDNMTSRSVRSDAHSTSNLSPGHNNIVQDVWDEEMDADDQETLAIIMGGDGPLNATQRSPRSEQFGQANGGDVSTSGSPPQNNHPFDHHPNAVPDNGEETKELLPQKSPQVKYIQSTKEANVHELDTGAA